MSNVSSMGRTGEATGINTRPSHANQPTLNDVCEEAVGSLKHYAAERPDVVALWCLGIGFVLGWKLKPW